MHSNIDKQFLNNLKNSNPCCYEQIYSLLNGYCSDLLHGCHAIRNYITLLIGHSGLMELNQPEIINNPAWAGIKEDLNGLKKLMDEINKVRYAHLTRKTVINYSELIQETISGCTLKISVAVSKEISYVYADKSGLQYVLRTLLDNIAETGIRTKVLISSHIEDSTLFTSVSDRLPIISEGIRNRLFELFNTDKQGHNGLSLAVSRLIMIAHEGDLTYSYNKGNTFTMSFRI